MTMESETVVYRNRDPVDTQLTTTATDLVIVTDSREARPAHRVILANFSSLLADLMTSVSGSEDEAECVLLLPDVSPRHLDLILRLAYSGSVAAVSRADITAISAICNLFRVKLDQFVVRAQKAEVKSHDAKLAVDNRETESPDVFDDFQDPDDQMENSQDDNGNGCFKCKVCDKTFIYAKSFERHMEVCKAEEVNVMESQNQIEPSKLVHVRNKISNSKKLVFKFEHYEIVNDLYYCRFPGCDYKEPFKTIGGCKNHQLRLHANDDEKKFRCQYCDEKFASNQLRNKHQNLMHIKRFPCDQCNKIFSEKTRLQIHYRIHSGDRPYVCEDCGFSCSQKDNLRIHKEFKHPSAGSQVKKFTCNVCSASFLTSGNLKRHEMTHSELKQFVCETCGKCFRDPGTLKQHTYSHGSANYTCDICDQKFTSPLYLNRHMMRLHPTDGIQPYVCGSCGKGFSTKSQLEEHIGCVHENKKHRCPQCNLLIGRRSSVARHLKKGRCRAVFTVPAIQSVS